MDKPRVSDDIVEQYLRQYSEPSNLWSLAMDLQDCRAELKAVLLLTDVDNTIEEALWKKYGWQDN